MRHRVGMKSEGMFVVPVRPPAERGQTCRASGWGMHRACVDDDGLITCPVCSRAVIARRDAQLGGAVRVIGEHDA